MTIELKIPSAGESITEVTIVEWLVQEGSVVQMDETLALIETDKANVELPAPTAGTITKILQPVDAVVQVGEVVATMSAADAGGAPAQAAPAAAPVAAPSRPIVPEPVPLGTQLPGRRAEPVPEVVPVSEAAPMPARGSGTEDAAIHLPPTKAVRASPSVRRTIMESGINPESLSPTGPGGFITRGDLQARQHEAPQGQSREQERVKMTPMRRRIASRLVEAQQNAALLTTFNEVDMTAVIGLRKKYQERFVAKHGIKLGFMSFFVKAAVEALKELPAINAQIDGDEVVYHNYCDVGVAVGGGRGLVVPVIRNAESLSFAQVEKTIADYGARAKKNRLKVEDLQGGTFTISNGGIYGSLLSTPIVNTPQSGILGMHSIQERPIVRDGQVVAAKMMYLALTYDHRLVDGREAVTFLVRIKELIEHPTRLVLEV